MLREIIKVNERREAILKKGATAKSYPYTIVVVDIISLDLQAILHRCAPVNFARLEHVLVVILL